MASLLDVPSRLSPRLGDQPEPDRASDHPRQALHIRGSRCRSGGRSGGCSGARSRAAICSRTRRRRSRRHETSSTATANVRAGCAPSSARPATSDPAPSGTLGYRWAQFPPSEPPRSERPCRPGSAETSPGPRASQDQSSIVSRRLVDPLSLASPSRRPAAKGVPPEPRVGVGARHPPSKRRARHRGGATPPAAIE
jgi:hypothetical protein